MTRLRLMLAVATAIIATPAAAQVETLWYSSEPGAAYFIPQSALNSASLSALPIPPQSLAEIQAQLDMATEHCGGHEDCSSRTVCGQMYQPASSLVELAGEYAFVAVAEVVAREAGWAVDGGVSTVVHFSLERVVRGTEAAESAAFALVVAGGSISVGSTEICSPGDSWKSLPAGTRVLVFGDWSERVDGLLEMAEWLSLDGSQIVTTNSHLVNGDLSMTVDQLASELASQGGGNES